MATNIGFNTVKEKLLCLLVLDDQHALALSQNAGEAFWRAFIVEDRVTYVITANFRFRYKDHDAWYTITPKEQKGRETLKQLEANLRAIFNFGAAILLNKSDVIESFYPPDDEGHPERTLAWLLKKDLVQITGSTGLEKEDAAS
jgi:hypothetical protein